MNTQKLDDTLCHRIDADLTHHFDCLSLADDLAAAHIRINCLTENLSFYAKTLAASEAARDRLIKENTVLKSKLDAHDRAVEYVMSNDDEAQAWAKFIGAWLFVIAFCVVGCAVTYWGFV